MFIHSVRLVIPPMAEPELEPQMDTETDPINHKEPSPPKNTESDKTDKDDSSCKKPTNISEALSKARWLYPF